MPYRMMSRLGLLLCIESVETTNEYNRAGVGGIGWAYVWSVGCRSELLFARLVIRTDANKVFVVIVCSISRCIIH